MSVHINTPARSRLGVRDLGWLQSRLGRYSLSPNKQRVKLRSVAVHQSLRPSVRMIEPLISPKDSLPLEAVAVNRSMLPIELNEFLDLCGSKYRADLERLCDWMIFLPHLDSGGLELAGFELTMTRAGSSDAAAFVAELSPGLREELGASLGKTMFFNWYFINKGHEQNSAFDWFFIASYLMGRMKAETLICRLPEEPAPVFSRVTEGFALHYEHRAMIDLAKGLARRDIVNTADIIRLRSIMKGIRSAVKGVVEEMTPEEEALLNNLKTWITDLAD